MHDYGVRVRVGCVAPHVGGTRTTPHAQKTNQTKMAPRNKTFASFRGVTALQTRHESLISSPHVHSPRSVTRLAINDRRESLRSYITRPPRRGKKIFQTSRKNISVCPFALASSRLESSRLLISDDIRQFRRQLGTRTRETRLSD